MSVEVTHICDICGHRQLKGGAQDMEPKAFKYYEETYFHARHICMHCAAHIRSAVLRAVDERKAG